MKINCKQKAALESYARSVIAAVVAVASTAALIPPVLRWANSKDPAFGRGSAK